MWTTSPVPDMGTTNPTNATDGDFFYNTSTNTLLVYSGGWHRIVPTPNLDNYSVILRISTAGRHRRLAADIQTVQTNLDHAAELQPII